MKKLIIIIPYFGSKPRWLNFFLASLAFNPEIDWLFISDFEIKHKPKNYNHIFVKFEDYKLFISKKLNIPFAPEAPYKLCDLKPAFGFLHYDFVKNYQFWGYSDIDLVYGDLLGAYGELLNSYDVISSHSWLLAGHFSIFRTMKETIYLFSMLQNWKDAFLDPHYISFDEAHMTEYLFENVAIPFRKLKHEKGLETTKKIDGLTLNLLFKERYTTFMGEGLLLPRGVLTQPSVWTWDAGKVNNDVMTESIIYSHFSFWNSGRWNEGNDPNAGIWQRNTSTTYPNIEWDEIKKFTISKDGFAVL